MVFTHLLEVRPSIKKAGTIVGLCINYNVLQNVGRVMRALIELVESSSLYLRQSMHGTFYKRNKKLVCYTMLSYINTWEFLRTLEKSQKHLPSAHASLGTSLIPACLYNSTMHCVFITFN